MDGLGDPFRMHDMKDLLSCEERQGKGKHGSDLRAKIRGSSTLLKGRGANFACNMVGYPHGGIASTIVGRIVVVCDDRHLAEVSTALDR